MSNSNKNKDKTKTVIYTRVPNDLYDYIAERAQNEGRSMATVIADLAERGKNAVRYGKPVLVCAYCLRGMHPLNREFQIFWMDPKTGARYYNGATDGPFDNAIDAYIGGWPVFDPTGRRINISAVTQINGTLVCQAHLWVDK